MYTQLATQNLHSTLNIRNNYYIAGRNNIRKRKSHGEKFSSEDRKTRRNIGKEKGREKRSRKMQLATLQDRSHTLESNNNKKMQQVEGNEKTTSFNFPKKMQHIFTLILAQGVGKVSKNRATDLLRQEHI